MTIFVLTLAHIAYALLEDVVSVLVHMCAQKVFEAVVDLQSRCGHRHPLSDRVTLHVLQVLNAFDHLFVFALRPDAFGSDLRQTTLSLSGPRIVFIFTVCAAEEHAALVLTSREMITRHYWINTNTALTVKQTTSNPSHALNSVPSSHGLFCRRPSARRQLAEIFIFIQTLHFITVQLWDCAVISKYKSSM